MLLKLLDGNIMILFHYYIIIVTVIVTVIVLPQWSKYMDNKLIEVK